MTAAVKSETNIKETIESILIAFILAFIFRCFVVEAFVIPTGSMAPTLMGAHMQFRCPDCGYRFAAGYGDADDTYAVPENANKVYSLFCPNCGLRIPRNLPNDPQNDAENPTVRYGDRILVMKYVYLLNEPQRWDVVVFKTPDTQGPSPDYTVNYIKRLTGRPGERLFVAQGDVYVAPNTGKRAEPSDFKIQTKPQYAQDALWRIVYDADYVPTGVPREYTDASGRNVVETPWKQPWEQVAGTGWRNNAPEGGASSREFLFDNTAGQGTLKFDDSAIPNKPALTDWLAYDQTHFQETSRDAPRDTIGLPSYANRQGNASDVSDLKLSFTAESLTQGGTLTAVLGKGDIEFSCEVSSDGIRLIKRRGAATKTIGQVAMRIKDHTGISFQNVDYRAAISIDGKEVLATTPDDYAPDVAKVIAESQAGDNPPHGWARLEGDHIRAKVSHLQLWRDVYYRDRDPQGRIARGVTSSFPNNVVELGKDEYFVMGDNSYLSSDARYWTSKVDLPEEDLKVDAGRVPGRFLLGRAFFVYWPAGFRAFSGVPPLVPNFGEMRFIR